MNPRLFRILVTAGWLTSTGILADSQPGPSSDAADPAPPLDELRRSIIDAFVGPEAYNETSRLALQDRLDESTAFAPCRAARALRDVAMNVFRDSLFEEVHNALKYPDHSLHVVRESLSPKRLDIVLFYFRIDKTPSVECSFTLGMVARREDTRQQTPIGSERDDLHRELKRIRANIEAALKL